MELSLGMEVTEWPPEDIEELSKAVNKNKYNFITPPQLVEEKLDEESIIKNYTEMGLLKKIELLGLSVRAANCLQEIGVNYVGDLILKTEWELLKLPNFGRKTLNELKESLSAMSLRFGMELKYWPLSNADEIAEQYNHNLAQNDDECLWAAFHRTMDNISDSKQLLIIEARLGLKGQIRTLEDIAQEFGVTRERVRQIQKKTTQTILRNEFWDDVLRIRLKALMSPRSLPLYIDSIQEEDVWFSGFEDKPPLLKNIISAFSEIESINFLEIDNREILTSINQEEWREIKYDLLNILEHSIEHQHTMDDIELFVEDKLLKANASELATIMFEKLSADLNFSFNGEEMILVSVGNSLSSHLRVVLESIDHPIHFEEIVVLYEEKYGLPISTSYVHSTLSGKEFLLFDRGTYGLPKHLKISEQDKKYIIDKIESVIRSGPEDRQWHSRNLLRHFESELFYQNLDQYQINGILQKSNDLRYLGKFIWKLKSSTDDDSERLHIKNVVYNILKEAGAPLHINDIHKEISKVRGLGEYIQLNPNKLFSKVGRANWGLIERDFILPLEKQEELKTVVLNILNQSQTAIHKTELVSKLDLCNLPVEMSNTHILGILISDERFKAWRGGFLGLANWKKSGRSPSDIVIKEIDESAIDQNPMEEKISSAIDTASADKTIDSSIEIISTGEIIEEISLPQKRGFIKNKLSTYLKKYSLFNKRD